MRRSRRFESWLHATAALALLGALAPLTVAAGTPAPARASAAPPAGAAPWWQDAVIYEIYPRSFQDSNGDGVGDLNGITSRLDYLRDLGVDAIWITPMYPSPQVDFGYDISDYENVDPQYGNLADFNRLVAAAAERHIHVVLDMVLNHTSDQHPWFLASASSTTDPKHDWYVWARGKTGPDGAKLPPNNWQSLFGHSAWEYVPRLDEYYYHKFYAQQPDLNWRNPAVENAMFGAMRFWLDRGVGGFRLDAVPALFEDPELRDERVLPGTNAFGDPNLAEERTANLPEVHAVLRRLRAMVDAYPGNRVLIGETYTETTRDLDVWYGGTRHDELQLPMDVLIGLGNKLDANAFRARIDEVLTEVHGSEPLLVFDNHDQPRSWDRYGDGKHDVAIAKQIATLLLTTRGSALMYYGQELGMRTTTPTRREDVLDPIGIKGWPKEKGRDGERTPMQWDASNPQAGFSTNAHTWLPVPANYRTVNVATESADPDSLLNWYRRLIALRRSTPAVHSGATVMLARDNADVFVYARTAPKGRTVLVALNLSPRPQTLALDLRAAGLHGTRVETLLASDPSLMSVHSVARLALPPFASWVAAVER
jgi:alpha-glucosidase